jgi:hypothetical protein
MSELLDKFSMVRGIVLHDCSAIVGMVDPNLVENKIGHCFFRVVLVGSSVSMDRYSRWNCVSAASHAGDDAVFLGEWGQIAHVRAGSLIETSISGPDIAPRRRGPLRALRKIEQSLFAAGMNRQVYRGSLAGAWSNVSCPAPDGISGFEAIDGFGDDEIYCVGWEGAICWLEQGTWQEASSPTNVVLTAVCCAAEGIVYAAARNGVILVGRRDSWRILEQDMIQGDIWSIAQGADGVYFATTRGVFRFDGKDFEPALIPATTFFDLHADGGALLSTGSKDLALFDGTTWQKLL